MDKSLFVAAVLSLLLSYDTGVRANLFYKKNNLREFLLTVVSPMWQAPLLITAYFFVLELWIPSERAQMWCVLFLLPASYAVSAIGKNGPYLTYANFILASYAVIQYSGDLWGQLGAGAFTAFVAVFIRVLTSGLEEQLRLSNVPNSFQGMPLRMFITAVIVITVWGLQGWPL